MKKRLIPRRGSYSASGVQLYRDDSLAWLRQQPPASVNLIFGSPPYVLKGRRYDGKREQWLMTDWIEWMLAYTIESVRVSQGYVLWVVNGAIKDGLYQPACEGLVYEAYKRGVVCERPCIWHKNAAPNRGDQYFSNAWEYVLGFKHVAKPATFNWEAVAEAPKYKSGGRFRQRTADGSRRLGNAYPDVKLARPRDVFYVTVGGGHMGHPLASENEAPYPEKLVEPFILALTDPGDTVLDPFSGSGTTVAVAKRLGRTGIGVDVRQSQLELAVRRLKDQEKVK